MTKLQSLQAVVELSEFLKFIEANQTHSFSLNRQVAGLMDLWASSMPNRCSDPPGTWDDVLTNRSVYMEYIEHRYAIKQSAYLNYYYESNFRNEFRNFEWEILICSSNLINFHLV
jgi:hypothetical protein